MLLCCELFCCIFCACVLWYVLWSFLPIQFFHSWLCRVQYTPFIPEGTELLCNVYKSLTYYDILCQVTQCLTAYLSAVLNLWPTLRCILQKRHIVVWNTCGYSYVKFYLIWWSFTHSIAKFLGLTFSWTQRIFWACVLWYVFMVVSANSGFSELVMSCSVYTVHS